MGDRKFLQRISPLLGVVIFGAALWVLHHQLEHLRWHQIIHQLDELPARSVALAVLLAVASYFTLTCYDLLGTKYLNWNIPRGRVMFASFISYAFGYNIGLSVLSSGSVRFRLYTAWGLSAVDVFKLVAFVTVTSWLGILTLAGVTFFIEPLSLPQGWHLPFGMAVRPIGIIFFAAIAIYLAACAVRRRPVQLGSWDFRLPPLKLALPQVIVGTIDWMLAASVLYVLIPPSHNLPFDIFLSAYLLSQMTGIVSQVPGGLGVFETMVILLLEPIVPPEEILSSILAYRAIYYVLPLMVGGILLGGYELRQRWQLVGRMGRVFGQWVDAIVPQILAFVIFITGAILVLSGAIPPVKGRLHWLSDILPLSAVELSHFLGSVVGVWLLFIGRGLQQRLRASYWMAVMLMAFGIVFSVIRNFDYKEAAFLTVVLLMLIPCKQRFYRHSSLLSQQFTPAWIALVLIVIAGSIWLGIFAYKHVEYKNELWWQFSLHADAPRFLRASVGIVAFALIFALARLMRPAPPPTMIPPADEMRLLEQLVRKSPKTCASLALLGDKHIFFNEPRTAFIMYGIHSRSWISMGDPIGPDELLPELVWDFREQADRYAAHCVFYEVGTENIPLYLDLGLALLKFGEEARVRLDKFSLESGDRREFRYTLHRFEREDCRFEVVPAESLPQLLPQFKKISDNWLADKKSREMGFSLGYFDPAYLGRFPAAVVWKGNTIVAFANLWLGAEKAEISPDLIRFSSDAPRNVMAYLFVQCILWAKEQGFKWFNLGMAPLAGLQNKPLAPLWSRAGAMIFRHGEHFYHFEGLRRFKSKFDPVWTPRYIASPGGLALPRILTDVLALIHSRGKSHT